MLDKKWLTELWEEATKLPSDDSPLAKAVIQETLEGSDDGLAGADVMATVALKIANDCITFAARISKEGATLEES